MDELRARLAAGAARVATRSGADLFRLPVDRAFSMAGVGTVVTGTAWSGTVAVGDAVRLLPSEVPGRVRSMETYGLALERSEPGARTAVGLAGVTREDGRRGVWLVAADSPWQATRALDVELRLEADAPRPLVAAEPRSGAPGHGRSDGAGSSRGSRSPRAAAVWRGWRSKSRSSPAAETGS